MQLRNAHPNTARLQLTGAKGRTLDIVAESIGVSRQAVSKWENGTSEPNTSNLMALAKLYGIPAEDLLKGVESALEAQEK